MTETITVENMQMPEARFLLAVFDKIAVPAINNRLTDVFPGAGDIFKQGGEAPELQHVRKQVELLPGVFVLSSTGHQAITAFQLAHTFTEEHKQFLTRHDTNDITEKELKDFNKKLGNILAWAHKNFRPDIKFLLISLMINHFLLPVLSHLIPDRMFGKLLQEMEGLGLNTRGDDPTQQAFHKLCLRIGDFTANLVKEQGA